MEKLPPPQRAAVVQRYYPGMSEAEMSEGGGLSPGTIKSRLYAARRSFERLLRAQVRGENTPATRERLVPVGAPPYPSKEVRT